MTRACGRGSVTPRSIGSPSGSSRRPAGRGSGWIRSGTQQLTEEFRPAFRLAAAVIALEERPRGAQERRIPAHGERRLDRLLHGPGLVDVAPDAEAVLGDHPGGW